MSEELQIPTPAAADRPSFTIKSGGSQISGEFQVKAVIVSREFNRVAAAEIIVLDGDPSTQDFKASNDEAFVPGAEIEISAGYHSNEEIVFQGIVIRHALRVHKTRPSVLRIECRDKAIKMTVGRNSKYFYDVTDAEIVEEIAADAGLQSNIESTQASHPQMVQFNSTDWDFVLTRIEANGQLLMTQDGELITTVPDSSTDPVLTLAYGGNILDFEATTDVRDQYAAVQSFAWDSANQEMIEIDADDPGVTSPGNLESGDLADVLGIESVKLKHGGQLKDDELQSWADAEWMRRAYSKVRGRVKIQGYASLKPGDVVELKGMGDRFNGNSIVAGLHHEINDKNWETDISLGLSAECFSSTAESIVEAGASGLLPGLSGLHVGLVTSLEDPDGENRIQLRIPMIDPAEEGIWARVATLDAGENRGSFFLPEVDDEVVVGFLNEDPRNPMVLGMLNSSAKPAPLEASDDNHEKGFVTRSEMKLVFNDDLNSISIETPNGNSIVLSDDEGSIKVSDENDNAITLSSDGITLESASDINITATGDVNIEGANIAAAASAEFKAEGSSAAEVSSGGNMVVKGSIVQIN
ncbi:MAG: type VI secretion system tip protein VgrG [Gammaproteobacteria bacterium]|nr:type VI secretion system tip protein VgrG [Gammaproteobacteria bacterium]